MSLPGLASSATQHATYGRAGRPTVRVEVVNHFAEPDGAYRHFFLQVHPELRPILTDGTYGAAQPLTARNAVASTFGLSGAEYAPEVET